MALAACSSGTEPTTSAFFGDTVAVTGLFRETASAALSGQRAAVDVMLQVMNQGTTPETLLVSQRGTCDGGVVVRAWHDVNGRQTLAWTSSAVPVVPCPGHALPLVIPPDSTATLGQEIANFEILGDSLAVGSYTFTVSADLQSPSLPAEVAAPTSVFVSPKFIVPPGTVLDGTWSGQGDGILLQLPLHWTADSVTGTGTYTAFTPNTNRCGGSTLRGSGSVVFAAARVEDRLVGHMSFDNGWTPPYTAVQTGAELLDGQFMSIDVGPCPMPLARQHPAPTSHSTR